MRGNQTIFMKDDYTLEELEDIKKRELEKEKKLKENVEKQNRRKKLISDIERIKQSNSRKEKDLNKEPIDNAEKSKKDTKPIGKKFIDWLYAIKEN